ncbi:metallo-beta-lactamase domain-containing protein [Besnoitia besnoiti]|uniref:Metallo-beta-lactamase domain-containing protein n=1 Tax=Besnoitia besnoiti TaxID=94643 RepID=A0A2A9M981_BESBE|nr:metallo-beta-lactamase domain-containing protein [Besnoitia besnoiti]PFH34555.1 metallo-beta-lactamase domain-containing protein [Besnoitia besnoiti]
MPRRPNRVPPAGSPKERHERHGGEEEDFSASPPRVRASKTPAKTRVGGGYGFDDFSSIAADQSRVIDDSPQVFMNHNEEHSRQGSIEGGEPGNGDGQKRGDVAQEERRRTGNSVPLSPTVDHAAEKADQRCEKWKTLAVDETVCFSSFTSVSEGEGRVPYGDASTCVEASRGVQERDLDEQRQEKEKPTAEPADVSTYGKAIERSGHGLSISRLLWKKETVTKEAVFFGETQSKDVKKPETGKPRHPGNKRFSWRWLFGWFYISLPLVSTFIIFFPAWYVLLPLDVQLYTSALLPRHFRDFYDGGASFSRAFFPFVLREGKRDPSACRRGDRKLSSKPRKNMFAAVWNSDEELPSVATGGDAGDAFSLPSVEELEREFFNYTARHVPYPPALHEHSGEFKKEIIQVVPDVYVAVGYGLANSVILNGTDGIVVVDTMESTATMQAVWADWLKLPNSNFPVKAIIYTHFHTDHIFGAAAIATPNVTEVHAYWLTYAEMSKVFTLTAGTTYRRSMRQFGVFVDEEDFLNAGIGPTLHYNNQAEIGAILPTHIMHGEKKTLHIAGMKLQLLHAPGESKDQIVVWLEDKRVLLGADNLYRSLPNIYAIRGTETRDCNDWIASLDLMRSLNAEYLVLGHTRPLYGKDEIQSTLVAYRDAIQFIHDQTVRYMNKGYYVNDISHNIKLPEHLANHPFLQPFYGTVPWAVRAIFTHYMGWYSGNPEDLAMMSTQEKAEALLSLAGSVDDLLMHAIENLRQGRAPWALELASAAYTVEPRSKRAKALKILALRANASQQSAATGRNWFLTAALELEGRAELKLSDTQKRQTLAKISLQQQFELLPVRLIPERARHLTCILKFHFSDVNENICVHFRKSIAYLKWPCEGTPDVEVESTRAVWLGIVNKDRSPAMAYATGDLKVKGSIFTLARALLAVELDAD